MAVTKDGKKWRSQFYYTDWQGKRHKKNKRGFRTKAEAESWERNFIEQQQFHPDILFENFVGMYLSDMENRLRESTMVGKRYLIESKILPYFKGRSISDITAADIRKWQNELMRQNYKPTYLKTINNQLSTIFNYACRYYDLKDNPCKKAGSMGKGKADEMNFWTKEEFERFLTAMEKKPEAAMAFKLLFWTGARCGEILAITFNDVWLDEQILDINKTLVRLNGKDVINPPKTAKGKRRITLPPFLVEELREYMSRLYGLMPNERIFRFTRSFLEHEMVRGCKETGVKRIRVHDLRHSHASLLVELGFDALEIKERLGHEKIATTLDTYSHLYPNKQMELADKLEAFNQGSTEAMAKGKAAAREKYLTRESDWARESDLVGEKNLTEETKLAGKTAVNGENVAMGERGKAMDSVVTGDSNLAGNSSFKEIGVSSGKVISLEDYKAAAN